MPWKHVGDARLAPSLSQDVLLIDVGGEDLYTVPVAGARSAIRGGRATLSRRYTAEDGSYRDVEQGASLRRSRTGLAVTTVIGGRLYALNRRRLEEVLDGITPAVKVVEKIEDASQLDGPASRQATLGAY